MKIKYCRTAEKRKPILFGYCYGDNNKAIKKQHKKLRSAGAEIIVSSLHIPTKIEDERPGRLWVTDFLERGDTLMFCNIDVFSQIPIERENAIIILTEDLGINVHILDNGLMAAK